MALASTAEQRTILWGIRRALVLPLVGMVRIYQECISRWTPRTCRFEPTCSNYAIEALQVHGPLKGSWLAARRILKCHPFGPEDPWDPVPQPGHRSRGNGSSGCCGGSADHQQGPTPGDGQRSVDGR